MEGGQTEEHIPTIYLMHLEEPYERMPNRRTYTKSTPNGRTLQMKFLEKSGRPPPPPSLTERWDTQN